MNHEDIEKIVNQIMERAYPFYNEGAHVQMLINRAIGNANKGSKRWVNKLISFNGEDFKLNCWRLLTQMYHLNDSSIRLYSSINARSYINARKTFAHRLVDNYDNDLFWRDINGSLVSALMQPENSSKRYYLLDCDSEQAIKMVMPLVPNDKLARYYSTPKGAHYIVRGFDLRPIKDIENVEIHRDGLMLLHAMPETFFKMYGITE